MSKTNSNTSNKNNMNVSTSASTSASASTIASEEHNTWVVKYMPHSVKDIVGNVTVIDDLMRYIKDYRMNRNKNAKDFSRAILISGPGGCGKTSFANLAAIYRGMIPIEISASNLRKKDEVQNFLDVYRSNVVRNYPPTSPMYQAVTQCLSISKMSSIPVGKCMILDELDAIGMSEKGLAGDIVELLKSEVHDPDNLMIITCDPDTLTKIKTLKGLCYHASFKAVADKEMIKLIDVVCAKESLPLTEEDKMKFVSYANGDARRLLNGMEFCFKNGVSEYNQSQLSSHINRFVDGNEDVIRKLQYSTLSAEKILRRTMELCLQGPLPMSIVSLIEPEMWTVPVQLYQTYLSSVRKNCDMDMLTKVIEELSYSEEILEGLKAGSPGIMSEEMGVDGDGEEEECRVSDMYVVSSVLNPVSKLRDIMYSPVKVDTFGYAKIYGISSSIKSQTNNKIKLKQISPYFKDKDIEELRSIAQIFAVWIRDKKYEELINFCISIHADPNEVLECLSCIKAIKDVDAEFSTTVNIDDVWRNQVKKDITKEYLRLKSKNVGVKFKDDVNGTSEGSEPKKQKIDFFAKYKK